MSLFHRHRLISQIIPGNKAQGKEAEKQGV